MEYMASEKISTKQRIQLWLAGNILPLFIRILGATWRLRIHGRENFLPERVIFAIWHGHIIAHSFAFRNEGIKVLISQSHDGELIARAIEKLGFGVIRGSSTRGGAQALLETIAELQNGCRVAFTPDGPKGPGYVVKEGVILASQKSGCPVVPAVVVAKPAIRLKSWDAFMIPLPFAKVEIFIREPMQFDSDEALEAAREKIQERMK